MFVILRSPNLYGDPRAWSLQKNVLFSLMSFVNTTKYPVSLLYTLMTLGPVLLIMASMEHWKKKFARTREDHWKSSIVLLHTAFLSYSFYIALRLHDNDRYAMVRD